MTPYSCFRAHVRLEFEVVSGLVDDRVVRVLGVGVWVGDVAGVLITDAFEVHAEPHHSLLQFGDGDAALTAWGFGLELLNASVDVSTERFVDFDFVVDVVTWDWDDGHRD